jgi:endonuclease YncB( thermonuclease family)
VRRLSFLLILLPLAGPAWGTELRQTGFLTGVVDAATVEIEIGPWLGQMIDARVRLRGITSPSLRAARCAEERRLAGEAATLLRGFLGYPVALYAAARADASDALMADVVLHDGRDLAALLIAAGLARPGSRLGDWCLP